MEYTVKSATYAMKGKQLLFENGIRSVVGKRVREEGCEYYLRISERYAVKAEAILKNGQVIP